MLRRASFLDLNEAFCQYRLELRRLISFRCLQRDATEVRCFFLERCSCDVRYTQFELIELVNCNIGWKVWQKTHWQLFNRYLVLLYSAMIFFVIFPYLPSRHLDTEDALIGV